MSLVSGYLAELRQQGLAAWTVITRDRVLRIWLNWCVERGSSDLRFILPGSHPSRDRCFLRVVTDAAARIITFVAGVPAIERA